jgi:hypothetical protein
MTKPVGPPRVHGRLLPRNDWEGDDATAGAGGRYVTCVDTAAGRMVAYATNGRIDRDGTVYRAAILPHDPNGITLAQVEGAVSRVAHLTLVRPSAWTLAHVEAHLARALGLVVIVPYAAIPRARRFQDRADFLHGLFVSHRGGPGYRVWDPLNPNTALFGRWEDPTMILEAIRKGGVQVAYVALEAL